MQSDDFGEFLARERRRLLRVAARVLRGRRYREDAEDVVQHVLLFAWARRGKLNPFHVDVGWTMLQVRSWLVTCVRQRAKNIRQGRKVDHRVAFEPHWMFDLWPTPKLDPIEALIQQEDCDAFFWSLTAKEREVVRLRLDGAKIREIATALSLTENAVATRLHGVRAKLCRWREPRR